jgi:hypothetical protein
MFPSLSMQPLTCPSSATSKTSSPHFIHQRVFRYISFQYWSYSLLAKVEFAGRTILDCGTTDSNKENDILDKSKCAVVQDVQAALNLPRPITESPGIEVGVIIGMIVAIRYGVYVVLKRKTRGAC